MEAAGSSEQAPKVSCHLLLDDDLGGFTDSQAQHHQLVLLLLLVAQMGFDGVFDVEGFEDALPAVPSCL